MEHDHLEVEFMSSPPCLWRMKDPMGCIYFCDVFRVWEDLGACVVSACTVSAKVTSPIPTCPHAGRMAGWQDGSAKKEKGTVVPRVAQSSQMLQKLS